MRNITDIYWQFTIVTVYKTYKDNVSQANSLRHAVFIEAFAKFWKGTIELRHVCLSDRIEHLASHWTDFHKICYLCVFFFRKIVKKIKISLKCNKNDVYFTGRPINIFIISRSIPRKMKYVSDKRCRGKQNKFYDQIFF